MFFSLEGQELDAKIMEGEENESIISDTKQFVSKATNDVSTTATESDLLSAPAKGVSMVQSNINKWFVGKETPFFY